MIFNFLTKLAAEPIISIASSSIALPHKNFSQVIVSLLGVFYFASGMVAIIIIIIAGLSLASSGGNPASVTKAKNAILYTVIGLVVIASAYYITAFAAGRFN